MATSLQNESEMGVNRETGRVWLWSKAMRRDDQQELRYEMEELREQSVRVGKMVRQMGFLE